MATGSPSGKRRREDGTHASPSTAAANEAKRSKTAPVPLRFESRASGGFRRFAMEMNKTPEFQSMGEQFMTYFSKEAAMIKLMARLQTEWMKLSPVARQQQEMAARDDAAKHGLEVMPKSSVKFKSALVNTADKLVEHPLTCFQCPATFLRIKALQQHLIKNHPLIAIFACHFCLKGFLSIKALTGHICANFNMLVAQKVAAGEQVLMTVAVHTVICADCGLQVPVLGTVMDSYSSFVKSHMTSQLQSVVSYFVDFPSEITLRNRLIEIDYTPAIERVPTKCEECQLDYESVDMIENHAQTVHDVPPKQCPVCQQSFYTNLMLRDHMLSIHLNDPANVVAFLDAVPGEPMKTPPTPNKDKAVSPPELQLQCDLCGVVESIAKFNTRHDCAISFTRRLVVDGNLVKCPGETVYTDVKVNMSKGSRLAQSLVRKFIKSATISFGAKLESVPTPSIHFRALSCPVCYAVSFGQPSATAHFHSMHGPDSVQPVPDDFDRTPIALDSVNHRSQTVIGFRCPKCGDRSCSLFALRRHMLADHSIFIPDPITFLKKDPSTAMARKSMHSNRTPKSPGGRVVVRNGHVVPLATASASSPSSPSRYVPIRAKPATDEIVVPKASGSAPPGGKWLCPVCQIRFDDCGNLTQHLTNTHLHMCAACSSCFVSASLLNTHKETCRAQVHPAAMFFCYTCGLTSRQLEDYYVHTINTHSDKVNFDDKTGQIYPICGSLVATAQMESSPTPPPTLTRRGDQPGSASQSSRAASPPQLTARPIVVNRVDHPMSRNECYLCGLPNPSEAQYHCHMQKHPEKWTSCFICRQLNGKNTSVASTEAFYSHIVQEHLGRIGICANTIRSRCPYCKQMFEKVDAAVRHVIFECLAVEQCQLCGVVRESEELLTTHRRRAHPASYERFSCNVCSRTFSVASSFDQHTCATEVFRCDCQQQPPFADLKAFYYHFFALHANPESRHCQICDQFLPNDQLFRQHIRSHSTVAKTLKMDRGRKMLINSTLAIRQVPSGTGTPLGEATSSSVASQSAPVRAPTGARTKRLMEITLSDDEDEQKAEKRKDLSCADSAAGDGERRCDDKNDKNDKERQKQTTRDGVESEERNEEADESNNEKRLDREKNKEMPDDNEMTTSASEKARSAAASKQSDMDDDNFSLRLDQTMDSERSTIGDEKEGEEEAASGMKEVDSRQRSKRSKKVGLEEETGGVEDEANEKEKSNQMDTGDDSPEGDERMGQAAPKLEKNLEEEPTTSRVQHSDEDDDVMVLDDVDDGTPGTTRLPQFACDRCSLKFRTHGALVAHGQTHTFDAGATSYQVFPVPRNRSVFVCRLCCLAYEDFAVQSTHVQKHGQLQACLDCSAVCFTEAQMVQHREAHQERKVVFGCSICFKAFESELRLHLHTKVKHNQETLFFCKACGFANVDESTVRRHIACRPKHCLRVMPSFRGDLTQQLGVCALRKLHYQPVNADAYAMEVAQAGGSGAYETPGECVHRSFLCYNEPLLSCDTCCTMVPASKLILENERLRRLGPIKLQLAQNPRDTTPPPASGSPASIVPRQPIRPSPAGGHPQLLQQVVPVRTVTGANGQLYAVVPTTAGTARQLVSSGGQTSMPTLVSVPPQATRPAAPPSQQRLVQQSTAARVVAADDPLTCSHCGQTFTSIAASHVHKLKHNDDTYFCLECGKSFRTEPLATVHVVSHCGGDGIKTDLQCPLCTSPPYRTSSVIAFRHHMSEGANVHPQHARLTVRSPGCVLLFASDKAAADHQRQHRDASTADSRCCIICGTGNMWTRSTASHLMLHGAVQWIMCRECGLCFTQLHQFHDHFRNAHVTQMPHQNGRSYSCTPCRHTQQFATQSQIDAHVAEKHKVHGLKLKGNQTIEIDDEVKRRLGLL